MKHKVPVPCDSLLLANRQGCWPSGIFTLSSANELFIVLLLFAAHLSIFKSVLEYNMQNTSYKILPAYFFPACQCKLIFLNIKYTAQYVLLFKKI
jgi:hypothetical protein